MTSPAQQSPAGDVLEATPEERRRRRLAELPTRCERVIWLACVAAVSAAGAGAAEADGLKQRETAMTVGVYYFGGWAGQHALADRESWARKAPTHLSRRLAEEFPEREPVWGWRDDTQEIMERQIDLAADSGVSFFAFCWYWQVDGKAMDPEKIRRDSRHRGLELFLKARNRARLKFCLLIANHAGAAIRGTENWKAAADAWLPYLRHPQYVAADGKPLLIIFQASGGDKAGFAYLQEEARKTGLPGVSIAACADGPAETGYTHRTHYNVAPGGASGSARHPFAELLEANQQAWKGSRLQPYIPIVTSGWDKRPWEGPRGLYNNPEGWYYPDRTPEQFADCLRNAGSWMEKHPDQSTAERLVLIYAWNEFGEGGYIAPTKGDPDAKYLKALESVAVPGSRSGQPVTPPDADKPRR